ncbi:hypothetical protein ATO12_09235 [Aquimarina atlantica]|uniref:Tail specific protease domain-containing protein n=1 Tax=Aquimarina atlantica TaxID=1317122 RepID=A0A023BXX7_9FLAO|nr:S41 family peptidase [Aquimarina atlantica]EZH74906.1 hypothetical protein ATO12_09235 [Aquimarina atlantica]
MRCISNKYYGISIVKTFVFLFLIFLGFACHFDDDLPKISSKKSFWYSESKGYILEISKNKTKLYSTSTAGCTALSDDFKSEDFFGIEINEIDANTIEGESDLILSNLVFTRLPEQKESCLKNQLSKTKDPKINFDHFWNIFNDYYVFFETRGVDWSIYQKIRDQVTEDNFYDILEQIVVTLEDGHVRITDEKNNVEIKSGLPSLMTKLNAHLEGDLVIDTSDKFKKIINQKAAIITEKYFENIFQQDERGNIFWGLMEGEIGYINISGMDDYSNDFNNEIDALNEVLDKVMNDIEASGVSKLILDIRFNGGGFDKISLDIASRFIDHEQFVFSKKERLGNSFTSDQVVSINPKGDFQYTGDIILLTSPITASAAEIFALCMKDLPYVTIVGENTNGIFSTVLTHTLPNGASVGLSNEVYSDANGVVFEAIGIGPDTEENRIPFLSTIDFKNNIDSGIEKAIALLKN